MQHELGKLIWPAVKEALTEERRKVLKELDKAVGEQKYVSTIGEVWRPAHEGRGRIFLVEEGFHCPAVVDESGMIPSPAEAPEAPGVIDDAVDEIIETMLAKQERVVFVENGQLAEHQCIALILRY
ncbi:MAG: hypothetical protein NZ553_02925 [Caldilinea sp.]|nr:hypothetical protein [Caldilinea sp.]MDW8439404.1 hypothetical protein [Caldilineaceae bacterium]